MPTVFFSYCHADEAYRDQLEIQLAALKRQGIIDTWHDRHIAAGQDFNDVIDDHINHDEIILLLVSPDFIASNYCFNIEMTRALERHKAEEAIVIPVILRHCLWHGLPFGGLMATPKDGKPVKQWPDIDEAFLQITKAVQAAAERWNRKHPLISSGPAFASATRTSKPVSTSTQTETTPKDPAAAASFRSSNLRLPKEFTQRDEDRFQDETFDYIANFFQNSLDELVTRNSGYEGDLRRIDKNRFAAKLYKQGKEVARATIFMGGPVGKGIYYSNQDHMGGMSYNESLSVAHDDQTLFLTTIGLSSFNRQQNKKLSQEGGAELFWELFIGPLQSGSRW